MCYSRYSFVSVSVAAARNKIYDDFCVIRFQSDSLTFGSGFMNTCK
jgi:hypothetical protein